jgi:hypothetical protein
MPCRTVLLAVKSRSLLSSATFLLLALFDVHAAGGSAAMPASVHKKCACMLHHMYIVIVRSCLQPADVRMLMGAVAPAQPWKEGCAPQTQCHLRVQTWRTAVVQQPAAAAAQPRSALRAPAVALLTHKARVC